MCEPSIIPARILVVVQGQARLLGQSNGRLISVGKFGPGSVIGAASLLTGQPCENVIAADEVVAVALTDELWSDLYNAEPSFRDWCDQQLWPQELLNLLEVLDESNAETNIRPSRTCSCLQQASCSPVSEAVESALNAGRRVFVTSAWGDLSVGQRITDATNLPRCERFGLRLVTLPLLEASGLAPLEESDPEKTLLPFESIQDADILPPVSSYSPERNVVDSLQLIRAEGSLQETLACFQMLAQLMKLPFRRDSIEKVLQDNLRRAHPELQLCGQLAASLGLHVMRHGASRRRYPFASALNAPLAGGFALVIASNERGLKLASPKYGMVSLEPADLVDQSLKALNCF